MYAATSGQGRIYYEIDYYQFWVLILHMMHIHKPANSVRAVMTQPDLSLCLSFSFLQLFQFVAQQTCSFTHLHAICVWVLTSCCYTMSANITDQTTQQERLFWLHKWHAHTGEEFDVHTITFWVQSVLTEGRSQSR